MKAYFINLDASTERLVHMTSQMQSAGIPFERFPAIDGTQVARPTGNTLTAGELGCIASHRAIWMQAANDDHEWTAIFEDDVFVAPELASLLSALQGSGLDADIVKFETNRTRVNLGRICGRIGAFDLRPIRSKHGGTAGYAIHRESAARLVKETMDFEEPLDFIFSPAVMPNLRALQVLPAPVIQAQCFDESIPSAIGTSSRAGAPDRLVGFAKLKAECLRPMHQLMRLLRREHRVSVPFSQA